MQETADRYKVALEISKNIFFPDKTILAPKGFNLNYLKFRVLRPVYKLYYQLFKLKFSDTPWTSQASIIILNSILNKKMVGLEYGSGKSTLYFASKLKSIVSIEHDKNWFEKIKQLLSERNVQNVDFRLIKKNSVPASVNSRDGSDSIIVKLGLSRFHVRKEYEAYYNEVKDFPDNYFDFVLVDGRARVECTTNAINKIKSKGILVLDNSERKRYKPLFKVLKDWPMINTTTGLTNTTFWFKP